MAEGLGRSEDVVWYWDILARLLEDVEPGAVFPLQALYNNIVLRHPGPPDAPVCGPHQSDGDPTLNVSVSTRLGLPPLFDEATSYPLQGSRRLHTQQPVDRGNKGISVSKFLEESLQVHFILFPLRLL